MIYFCCDEKRRSAVKESELNGIDFLEVLDLDEPDDNEKQRTLLVHFLKSPPPAVTLENIVITGGERITNIRADKFQYDSDVLRVHVNGRGDFSTYTLRLIRAGTDNGPLEGLDPALAEVEFSFKVECPSDFDCKPVETCPPEALEAPEIDYLAKDYSGFRQLMLDRMALLVPQWKDRNVADIGIALVELLAYVGDHLSYKQDAVATEAYLSTARKRISIRRHTRLVDYFLHEGCNSRVWIHVDVNRDGVELKADKTQFLTRCPGMAAAIVPSLLDELVSRYGCLVFKPMEGSTLYIAHNRIQFYTASDEQCCLPKGATEALLLDDPSQPETTLRLAKGDVLVFQEMFSPTTGSAEDADDSHRHAVRIQELEPSEMDRVTKKSYVRVRWHDEDALPFPLCISAKTQEGYKDDISIAFGNVILADHGMTVLENKLKDGKNDTVPEPALFRRNSADSDHCTERVPYPIYPRFNPRLQKQPLTYAAPYDRNTSAAAAGKPVPQKAKPSIELNQGEWSVKTDLLESDPLDKDFVVEIDTGGTAFLRFGNGRQGLRPPAGAFFEAEYRIGNGTQGNIGAYSVAHLLHEDETIRKVIDSVYNPLPAQGGTDAESIEQARVSAPYAFRTQERAVTLEDYAYITARQSRVQKAAASFRWTGSWHTVFVTVDQKGGKPLDEPFEKELRGYLDQYRMAGSDVHIDDPRYVSLELEMQVCVLPDYFRSQVQAAILEIFSNRILPDGTQGFFHPDNFTFGQPVYLSQVYAAAQNVAGVHSINILSFQRQGIPDDLAVRTEKLLVGRLEIVRLENDPNFPERGVLKLHMEGGK